MHEIKALGENRNSIKDEDFDVNANIQSSYTKTELPTKPTDKEKKLTIINLREKTELYTRTRKKGLNSARMKVALSFLPKAISEIRNPTSPAIKNIEDFYEDVSHDLGVRGFKNNIPSNMFDFYTRIEINLGLKLSGHTDTLAKASNLIDELHKRGQIQNEQQYRNAPNEFCQV